MTSGINDVFVLDAFRRVPRHGLSIPQLPIQPTPTRHWPLGYQQTLSQPSVVARMLELLRGGHHLAVCSRLVRVLASRQASCAI